MLLFKNFGIHRFWVIYILAIFCPCYAFSGPSPFEIDPSRSPPMYTSSHILTAICHPQEFQFPTTTGQILEIVRDAIAKNLTVKAFGKRHSSTDIICTEGVAIDMENFKETIQLNSDDSVTVSAGYTLREVGEFLHAKGRSFQGGPAIGEITIGGAIGTGAHGSSLNHKTILSDMLIGVEIVDGYGKIQKISSSDFLRAYRCNLGLLGILTKVTLETVPDFKITAHNYELPDEILTNGKWKSIVQSSDYLSLNWFPNLKTVVVSTGTIVPVTAQGKAENHFTPKTSTLSFNLYGTFIEFLQAFNFQSGLELLEELTRNFYLKSIPGLPPLYSEDGSTLENPATGYHYLMQDSVCSPECPWQIFPYKPSPVYNSMFLDLKHFEQVILRVKQILAESKASFLIIGVWIRFVKASDSYLAPNYGRDSFTFEFNVVRRNNWYEDASSGISTFQTILQVLALEYNGRPHWGKTGFAYHSQEMLQRKISLKNHESFLTIREKVDPYRIFMNDFGRRLLGESDKMNIDPSTTHCALQDICICKADSDCADGQTCGHLPSLQDYPVCL